MTERDNNNKYRELVSDVRVTAGIVVELANAAKANSENKEKLLECLTKIGNSGNHILEMVNEISAFVLPKEKSNITEKHILLVEDNDLTREITFDLLSDKGLFVDSCSNGKECIDFVEKRGIDYYTAILMDINMPVMNGYEAAIHIRKKYPMHHVPIIAVTASSNEEDRERSIVAGIDAHIAKPIRVDEIFDAIINSMSNTMTIDILTGTKNRIAYQDADAYYNKLIRENRAPEFAIVVFDINDLKKMNDECGHAAGDKLIKEATKLICEQYKHSPVYRFGGDEFVALLTKSDYENRDELLSDFRENAKKNALSEGPVVASGMSVFDNDSRMSDIFKRADSDMYNNKTDLKKIKKIFNA